MTQSDFAERLQRLGKFSDDSAHAVKVGGDDPDVRE